jgi:hypothetical protein
MSDAVHSLAIGVILILPGLYLLWFANEHPEFYHERRWEKWTSRYSILLGLIFRIICRYAGLKAVKHAFRIFAVLCIGMGIWAISTTWLKN